MGFVEVSHLAYKREGARELLHDVSFRVGEGERVALVGDNGTGKSTILRLIAATAARSAVVEDQPTGGVFVLPAWAAPPPCRLAVARHRIIQVGAATAVQPRALVVCGRRTKGWEALDE